MCQAPACTNGLCNLFPPPRAGIWVVRASSVVGWPWTRSVNSLCGPLLLVEQLHWTSGPLPRPSPGLRCRVACAMTSPHWSRPPPAALARPVPVPMALPSHPRTFSVLGYCHWSFSALLVQVLWDWTSFGWDPCPAPHAVTHGPRSPFSWMCPPSRLSDTMRYHAIWQRRRIWSAVQLFGPQKVRIPIKQLWQLRFANICESDDKAVTFTNDILSGC